MNLKEIKFPYFPSNIETRKPLGEISLYELLYAIKHPKKEIVNIFKQIQEASSAGNKELKAQLKAKLWYFTPCVQLDGKGRSYENIISWTTVLVVDIDNIDYEYAVELKQHFFETYSFVIASFLSSSRRGVKLLVRIPNCKAIEEFKSYFYGLMDEFQYYRGIDFSSKNCVLPFYLTYDEDLLYRLDATEWNRKGIQVDEFKTYEGDIIPVDNVTEEDIKHIKNIIRKMFNSITDTGHLIVRSASLLMGGYTSAYGLDLDEMRDFIFELIDDTPYLQKSLKTYKKTASDMLLKGSLSPVYLNKNER